VGAPKGRGELGGMLGGTVHWTKSGFARNLRTLDLPTERDYYPAEHKVHFPSSQPQKLIRIFFKEDDLPTGFLLDTTTRWVRNRPLHRFVISTDST